MKIFRYSLTIALVILALSSTASDKPTEEQSNKQFKETGLRIGFNLSRPFQSLWTKGDRWGAEFSADVEFKPDLFVTAEAGWEKLKIEQERVNYNANGSYLRIGADYNMLNVSDELKDKSTLFIGLRYGLGASGQTVENYNTESYWGKINGSFGKQNYFSHWGEVVLGMKAEIAKNIYLGWDIRVKFLVGQSDTGMPPPYFVAGYGTNNTAVNFDFSYSIIYSIPFNIRKGKQNL